MRNFAVDGFFPQTADDDCNGMNLAHETDLLRWLETTVIDQTCLQICVVFPLVIIEAIDLAAGSKSA
jgi:hypothetical protein